AVLSRIFLKEAISPRVWAAIACGVLGISLLSLAQARGAIAPGLPDDDSGMNRQWVGNVLIFGAVVCEATYAVIGKKLTAVLSPKRISAVINLWGFVLMTPMGLYTALHFDFTAVRIDMWVLVVFYALAASVWTVWLWMKGL